MQFDGKKEVQYPQLLIIYPRPYRVYVIFQNYSIPKDLEEMNVIKGIR